MHVSCRHLQIAAVTATAVLLAAPVFSCSSAPEQRDDMEEFIGAPPTQDEDDPLFRHALPAEAVPADPTGTVGDIDDEPGDEPPAVDQDPVADDPDEPQDDELAAAADDEADAPDVPVAEEEFVDPPPEVPDGREACFSCVRICPIDDGRPDCPNDPDDLICGWGSHEDDPEQARRVAEAQCESSLDMARHMPNYADIEGECPTATCR